MAADTETKTESTTDIYPPDTLISIHTCRPLTNDSSLRKEKLTHPSFWCEEHQCQLKNVASVISHFRKKHRKESTTTTTTTTELKRKHPDVEGITDENGHDGVVAKRKRGSDGVTPSAVPPEHLKCELCDIDFTAPPRADMVKLALLHFKSKKHIAKLEGAYQQRMANQVKCTTCDVEFTSVLTAFHHYKGRKHIAKAAEGFNIARQPPQPQPPHNGFQQSSPFGAPPVPPLMNGGSGGGCPMNCELCGVSLTSPVNAHNHFNGKKHLNRVRMMSVGNGV